MERISISKGVAQFLIYFGSLISVLVLLLGDKECDKNLKFHAYQTLVCFVLNLVCGIGGLIALIFAIIALVKGEAPKLPWIGDKLQEMANK